jgi:RNA polymerase sigma factor (TIGR02999 family)
MGDTSTGEITQLLNAAQSGDSGSRERLSALVYAELRRIGAQIMASERTDHTLQATVLASEAYYNLVGQTNQNWQSRVHFFAVAARAMRQVLVDYSRRRKTLKRGGTCRREELADTVAVFVNDYDQVLALDQALSRLALLDERQSLVVELRYFGGLTEEETAEVLQVSVRTVKREWSSARAWLYAELSAPPNAVSKDHSC